MLVVFLSLQRQRIQAIETEIEGYRKSISKAQEQNEQITLMHNKIEADISMVKKLMALSKNKQEVLKAEYSKYTRTLHETEQQLSRAETVSSLIIAFPRVDSYKSNQSTPSERIIITIIAQVRIWYEMIDSQRGA